MNRLLFCSEINFNYILNKQQAFVLLLEVWGWSFTLLHWMNNYTLSYSGKGKIKSPSTREQYLCTRRKKVTHSAAPYLFIEWDDVTQSLWILICQEQVHVDKWQSPTSALVLCWSHPWKTLNHPVKWAQQKSHFHARRRIPLTSVAQFQVTFINPSRKYFQPFLLSAGLKTKTKMCLSVIFVWVRPVTVKAKNKCMYNSSQSAHMLSSGFSQKI